MNNQDFNNSNIPQSNPPQPSTPPTSTGKGFSIASLVLGIISCVLAWFYLVNIAALVLSIIGVVLAALGRKKAKLSGAPTGIGTAGLVLSIIALSLSAIGFIACTLCVSACTSSLLSY